LCFEVLDGVVELRAAQGLANLNFIHVKMESILAYADDAIQMIRQSVPDAPTLILAQSLDRIFHAKGLLKKLSTGQEDTDIRL
jgi:beta-galactosidase GanA